MKKIRKLLSLVLAMVMVLAMAAPSWAAEKGSITINGTEGQKYTIYKILDLESYNADSGAYAYKTNETWSNFINRSDIKGTYVDVDEQGYVTWIGEEDDVAYAKFAKLALEYAKESRIEYEDQGVIAEEKSSITFDELELGYYLVDSNVGALCALTTTNPDASVDEKNEAAVNVKTVEEDSSQSYGEENDADIEQEINFKSTITAKKGAENYVLHDKMDSGLSFDKITGITLNGITVPQIDPLDDEYNYDITYKDRNDDGCAFEITFTKKFCEQLQDDDTIVVSYTAHLNENAVIAGNGNKNTSWLTYGDEQRTTDSETITKTWQVEVYKYTNVKNDLGQSVKTPLAGATFTLSKESNGNNPIKLVSTVTNTYRVDPDAEGSVTEITTDDTGRLTIEGLDSDTYYLTETNAPAGYNRLPAPVKVEIANDGTIKMNGSATTSVEVENTTGGLLPSTGGIGTTVFYAAGIVLMAGAVFFVVRRKRA